MKLIDDWRRIVVRAWSMRLTIIAAALSGAEVILPMFSDVVPRGVFAVAAICVSVGAAVARLVAQPEMHDGK